MAFGSQIRKSQESRQHVLLRHGCHGLLKFEPQNATLAKVTALPGRNFVRNFVRKGFCQEAGSARKEFCQEGFCQEAGSARKEFCQEGILSGSGLCLEGILSGKVFVRKRALPGRDFVRKGFCQEAGSARKEFCQERFLSGRNFVRKGFCQEAGSARKGESALELGVKLFVAAVVRPSVLFWGGGGPISFRAVKGGRAVVVFLGQEVQASAEPCSSPFLGQQS